MPHYFESKGQNNCLSDYLPDIIKSRDLAQQWLINNIKENGSFVYSYNPDKDQSPAANNDVRQLMASRALAELALQNSDYLSYHQRNLTYVLQELYQEDGELGYVEWDNKSKLGGIAMLLRTLSVSPLYTQYSGVSEKLATTILSLQQSDGSFRARYKAPSYSYNEDYLLTFYSGEAIVALLEYYHKIKDTKILNAALLAQKYYLDKYITNIDANYYPAYVPWHSIALSYLYDITWQIQYAQAIFILNDKLIDEMLHTNKHEPHLIGRFYNPLFSWYGSAHSSSDGIYTEWVAYAYDTALKMNDQYHIKKYHDALVLAVNNLMRLQYQPNDTGSWKVDSFKNLNIIWAIRIHYSNPSIRVDTTQHALDAFNKILSVAH